MPVHAAKDLSDGIAALSQGLTQISFGSCKLGDKGMTEVANCLQKHNNVSWLGLFDCEATNYGLSQLLSAVKGNKSLMHLDLGRNPELGDEGIAMLCDFLHSNKTVKEVYLWETGISDAGAKKLVSMLRSNRYIERLDLNDNPSISQGMKAEIASLIKEGPSRVPASPRAGPVKA